MRIKIVDYGRLGSIFGFVESRKVAVRLLQALETSAACGSPVDGVGGPAMAAVDLESQGSVQYFVAYL